MNHDKMTNIAGLFIILGLGFSIVALIAELQKYAEISMLDWLLK